VEEKKLGMRKDSKKGICGRTSKKKRERGRREAKNQMEDL
jgi:hypothetical protein